MKKILIAFGTRPEAIKMAPLVLELRKSKKLLPIVMVTGQHRQMLDQVLDCFGIVPEYDLSIMKKEQTLFEITSDVLLGTKKVLEIEKPEIVLVHGDTTTAFTVGLAAFYKQIPVGHVEAGLRTNNIYSPYPEELNRQAIDLFTKYYFTPTENSKENLLKEGKKEKDIFVTGNTGIDAMKTTVRENFSSEDLEWAKDSRLILLTAHRRENLGEPLKNMFSAIKQIVDEFPAVKVIYPVHLNPAVLRTADEILGNHERIRLIAPLEVVQFHNYMKRAHLILTDSGGIQEEAPSLGKPVLVMRDTTERPEGIKAGTLKLSGTKKENLYRDIKLLLTDKTEYDKMAKSANPYGDGFASERIVKILETI